MIDDNINKVIDFITQENPVAVVKFTGGPFRSLMCSFPTAENRIVMFHKDQDTGHDFISEYIKKGIWKLGVWEYEFYCTYREEEDEDEF